MASPGLGILLGLTITLVVVALIARPLVGGTSGQQRPRTQANSVLAQQLERYAQLLEQRTTLYTAIRDLDFEHETGKLAAQDHALQRAVLVEQGVAILKKLDAAEAALPADHSLEAAISALRRHPPDNFAVPVESETDVALPTLTKR